MKKKATKKAKPAKQVAPPPLTFGKRLRDAREGAGMSQQDLGDVVGIDKRSVARYEQGGALPSIEAAAKLAKPLGASLDALAGMPVAAASDPELSRLLARFAELNDFDRAAIKRVLAMALAGK